mgnify:CR=1 FL=1
MMDGYGGHGWGMGWGWIIGLAFLVVIVWVIVRLVNQYNQSGRVSDKSAMDILKERYAKGEINKQEFEERKKDL